MGGHGQSGRCGDRIRVESVLQCIVAGARKLTDEQVAEARVMRADERSYAYIGKRLGVGKDAIRCALDPVAREAMRTSNRVRQAERRADNPEAHRVRGARWDASHVTSRRAKWHRRRARRLSAPGVGWSADIEQAVASVVYGANPDGSNAQCAYCLQRCRAGTRYHLDHIVPLCRQGTHEPSNFALACATCNNSKGAKLLTEWRNGAHVGVAELARDVVALLADIVAEHERAAQGGG